MFLSLAPLALSGDMFIALFFCYFPPLIIFYYGWKASKSGSYQKEENNSIFEWKESKQNVPFVKTSQFAFGLLWLILGSLFFWAFLYPDHHDVWFK